MKNLDIKPGNKKEAILRAAVTVFSRKGYHNTRMEEIAAVAGAGKGTIYEYFGSKLQLFQEIMESSWNLYSEKILLGKQEQFSVKEHLRILFEGHIRFCIENRQLTKMVYWDTETIDDEIKEWSINMRHQHEKNLEKIIIRGIKQGELKEMDAKMAVWLICGVITYISIPLLLEETSLDPAYMASHMAELVMEGLQKTG